MAGGSGQNDSGNVNTTIMSDGVPNVYYEFLTENAEVTHDMDDEYVFDDLESLSGSDGEGDVEAPTQETSSVPVQVVGTAQGPNTDTAKAPEK
ncbi:putative ribosomal RNA small subunit methyltransferase, partial [Sesbania bispinosa]